MIASITSPTCPRCGVHAPGSALHCPRCGTRLVTQSQPGGPLPLESRQRGRLVSPTLALIPLLGFTILLLSQPGRQRRPLPAAPTVVAAVAVEPPMRPAARAIAPTSNSDEPSLAALETRTARLSAELAEKDRQLARALDAAEAAYATARARHAQTLAAQQTVSELRDDVRQLTARVREVSEESANLRELAESRAADHDRAVGDLRAAYLSTGSAGRWKLLADELARGGSVSAQSVVRMLGIPSAERVTGVDLKGRVWTYPDGGTVTVRAGAVVAITPPQ
ncbi:MAG: hypothetical protein ACAI43_24905 [Phycisphaerae bacterium]